MTTLKDVQTGDILTWKRDRRNKISDLLIRAIRFFTHGDYGHVAVAIRLDDYVFVIEASLPMVKLTLVNPDEEIYHIPMQRPMTRDTEDFMISILGLPYGIMDALRAGLGLVSQKDDKWQCAELVKEYLRRMGFQVACDDTPDSVVKNICWQLGKPIFLLKKD